MSSLSDKQWSFLKAVAALIRYAEEKGYKLTVGDAYRDRRVFGDVGEKKGYGNKDSLHKSRMAIDFNLFIGGQYITGKQGHDKLHEFWVSLGGNEMIEEDPNHYSFPLRGMR